MQLICVGLNHRTAPVQLRERMAVKSDRVPALLAGAADGGFAEAVILSTCNRVEVYGVSAAADSGRSFLHRWIAQWGGVSEQELSASLYCHEGPQAARHLFRVAAGLDSMVLGETEVLGQVKEAYLAALSAGTTGPATNPLFQAAFRAAKAIHTETGISQRKVSVGSVAVELASKIFRDLDGRRILVIGAGQMAALVLEHLCAKGARHITIANRSPAAAQELAARVQGEWVPFARLEEALAASDIVVSSTASPQVVLTRSMVDRASRERRHRPMLLVDIAVPRDIDPEAADLSDVFLYDIDALERVISENLRERERELPACEGILDRHLAQHLERFAPSGAQAGEFEILVARLRSEFDRVGIEEMDDLWQRAPDVPPERRRLVEATARKLLGRISQRPEEQIRAQIQEGDGKELMQALKTLFRL